MHRPAGVTEVAFQLAENRRHGEVLEADAATRVIAIDRLHEAEAGDLLEVIQRLACTAVPAREFPREWQVLPDKRLTGVLVPMLLPTTEQILGRYISTAQ